MTSVNVDSHFIGAGRIYRSGALVGWTREDNAFRIVQNMAAPRLNGVGGKLKGTDYRVDRDMAQLEFTLVDLSADTLPVLIPSAESSTDSGDTIVGEAVERRLPSDAYAPWELRVPGIDGTELRLTIHNGIVTSNVELTASDSETPLGPRVTVESRIDNEDVDASAWAMRLVAAAS